MGHPSQTLIRIGRLNGASCYLKLTYEPLGVSCHLCAKYCKWATARERRYGGRIFFVPAVNLNWPMRFVLSTWTISEIYTMISVRGSPLRHRPVYEPSQHGGKTEWRCVFSLTTPRSPANVWHSSSIIRIFFRVNLAWGSQWMWADLTLLQNLAHLLLCSGCILVTMGMGPPFADFVSTVAQHTIQVWPVVGCWFLEVCCCGLGFSLCVR